MQYDVALKTLIQGSARLLMEELAGAQVVHWLHGDMPKVQERRADLLGETADGTLVHIELQSTNDPDMPLRMAEYYLLAKRIYGKRARQVVLYVGEEPMRMPADYEDDALTFRYRLMDIRELDGERLIASDSVGDNVIAILTRLRDHRDAVHRILAKVGGLAGAEREAAMAQLFILAGLRHEGDFVRREVEAMPILTDIMDHDVLGPEIRKAEARVKQQTASTIYRRMLERRFGALPEWALDRLSQSSTTELEAMTDRVLDAPTLSDVLQ